VDLRTYLRILRRRWPIVVAAALGVTAVSAVLTILTPRSYQSTAQFFVSTSDNQNTATLAQGNVFTQQRIKSYAQLLKTPKALDPVAVELGGNLTASELATKVAASVPPDSVLLDVVATDGDPAVAQEIAEGVAATFPTVIDELEKTNADGTSPVKVTVVKEATLQSNAVSPRPARNLALGLVLGLLLGFGLVVLRELLDNKVRTKDDLEQLTDVTVLGGIPFDSDTPKHPLILHSDPLSGRAEAFRTLRTNLQFVDIANHPRTIVVTSSIAGEGKSCTSANLALALAESGAKVCIIEGDLRRPRLLDYMGLEGSVGLTDVLIGKYELIDVLQPFGRLSLQVLGAGPIPPNPSELLGSQGMRDLLATLRRDFDYVVIDAPPLLPVTDGAVLSTQVDGGILVVGSGVVTKDQVDHALESLEAVNGRLLGMVLNRVPRGRSGGYYDYRYEYKPTTSHREASGRRKRTAERGAPEPRVPDDATL